MEKDIVNETVDANIKINNQLEDGQVHTAKSGLPEAEKANVQMQESFRGENEEHDINASPAAIVTPS